MPDYLEPPFARDQTEIADSILAELVTRIPGYQPTPGDPITILAESLALEYATLGVLATDTVDYNFLPLLGPLLHVPYLPGVLASGATTFTLTDNLGHLIPAGTLLAATSPAGEQVAFRTRADVTVVAPATTATVLVEATEIGAGFNDITGSLDLIDALPFVQSVVLNAATSGGREDETNPEYLDRFVDETQLLAPLAVTASDFEILARRYVYRALALDNTLPNGTTGVEGAITVAVVDQAGAAIPDKSAVTAALDGSDRVLALNVNVVDPSYTTVSVAYAAKAKPGRDLPTVKANLDAAIALFLSPADWGNDGTATNTRDPSWRKVATVRYQDLVTAVNNADGVDYYTTLTLNGGTSDVALTGLAPLPAIGTITGTVT